MPKIRHVQDTLHHVEVIVLHHVEVKQGNYVTKLTFKQNNNYIIFQTKSGNTEKTKNTYITYVPNKDLQDTLHLVECPYEKKGKIA